MILLSDGLMPLPDFQSVSVTSPDNLQTTCGKVARLRMLLNHRDGTSGLAIQSRIAGFPR